MCIRDRQGPDVLIRLDTKNPQAPKNKVIFSHETGSFIRMRLKTKMIDHMNIVSTILHKESEEAKQQMRETEESVNSMITVYDIYIYYQVIFSNVWATIIIS